MSQLTVTSLDISWKSGGTNSTPALEALLNTGAKCTTVPFVDQATKAVIHNRDFCLCGDGVAVGEPFSLPGGRMGQAVMTHEIITGPVIPPETEGARTIHWRLGVVIVDDDGELVSTVDANPKAPTVSRLHDASVFTSLNNGDVVGRFGTNPVGISAPRSWNVMKAINPGFDGLGDGGRRSGDTPWFYNVQARAHYHDAIVFQESELFIPNFANGNQIFAVDLKTGEKIWEKLGWENVPADLLARNNTNDPLTIPALSSKEWVRTFYSPVCRWGRDEIFVHFEELTQSLNSISGGPYSFGTFPTDDIGSEVAQWFGRWQAAGRNESSKINPNSADPVDADGSDTTHINDLLAQLESELDQVLALVRNDSGPRWVEWKTGYMIINARTGAVKVKSYYSDEVQIDAPEEEDWFIRRGQLIYTKTTKGAPASGFFFGPTVNDVGDPDCDHAGDCETLIEDPVRICKGAPPPPPPTISIRDWVYSDEVPLAGYIGGRHPRPGDTNPDDPELLYVNAKGTRFNTGLPSETITYWLYSPLAGGDLNTGDARFIFEGGDLAGAGSDGRILDDQIHYRFYTPVVYRKYHRPTPWHSNKVAARYCPIAEKRFAYAFPRCAPRTGLTRFATDANDVDTEEKRDEHNELCTKIASVYCLEPVEGDLSIIWQKSLHDPDALGAPPDAVDGAGFANTKEARHGAMIGSPFLSDDFIFLCAADWSNATAGGVGIEYWALKLDINSGDVLQKRQFMGDATPINPDYEGAQLTAGDYTFDTFIAAACELWFQAPNLRARVTGDCEGGSGSGSGCPVGSGS